MTPCDPNRSRWSRRRSGWCSTGGSLHASLLIATLASPLTAQSPATPRRSASPSTAASTAFGAAFNRLQLPAKGEFETTAENQARVGRIDDRELRFTLPTSCAGTPVTRTRYMADEGRMVFSVFLLDRGHVIASGPRRGASEWRRFLPIACAQGATSSYAASNAFGAARRVTKTEFTMDGVLPDSIEGEESLGDSHVAIFTSTALDARTAQAVSKSARFVVVLRPERAHIAGPAVRMERAVTPTIDLPVDQYMRVRAIYSTAVRIEVYEGNDVSPIAIINPSLPDSLTRTMLLRRR